jgi:hypothetical protein
LGIIVEAPFISTSIVVSFLFFFLERLGRREKEIQKDEKDEK